MCYGHHYFVARVLHCRIFAAPATQAMEPLTHAIVARDVASATWRESQRFRPIDHAHCETSNVGLRLCSRARDSAGNAAVPRRHAHYGRRHTASERARRARVAPRLQTFSRDRPRHPRAITRHAHGVQLSRECVDRFRCICYAAVCAAHPQVSYCRLRQHAISHMLSATCYGLPTLGGKNRSASKVELLNVQRRPECFCRVFLDPECCLNTRVLSVFLTVFFLVIPYFSARVSQTPWSLKVEITRDRL